MIKIIKDNKYIRLERDGVILRCPFNGAAYCCNDCPFFEYRPKTLGYPESVLLKCLAQEITFCEGEEE
jgi:hypothetical protein